MCFRAQQTHSEALVQERFGAKGSVTKRTYNGFAHPKLTGLCASKPHQLSLLRWGLIPHWAKVYSTVYPQCMMGINDR